MNATERRTLTRQRFADRHGLSYDDVAKLSRLTHRAHSAGERYCSIDRPGLEEAHDRAQDAFERAATVLGFITSWPSLWPLLHKDSQDVHLPE